VLAPILARLSTREVRFALGGSVYDWNDPFARMFLQILSVVAEFEVHLVKLRTREGMAIARAKGKLRGKKPKLPPSAQRTVAARYTTGQASLADLTEEYSVSRTTIHRIITNQRPAG
jgi:DNA invertase Pin-like site-specific DNA recombinase